jgi:hypothetical protein
LSSRSCRRKQQERPGRRSGESPFARRSPGLFPSMMQPVS